MSCKENHYFKERWFPYRHPVYKGLKRCFQELDKFEQHVQRIELHRWAYPEIRKERSLRSLKGALVNWIQQGVLNSTSMRHKEILGAFACMKSLIRAFQPLLNGKKLKILIRQFEENPSLSLYLDHICDSFRRAFSGILGHARRFRSLESFQGYPEFVNERIKTIAGSAWSHPEFFLFNGGVATGNFCQSFLRSLWAIWLSQDSPGRSRGRHLHITLHRPLATCSWEVWPAIRRFFTSK